MEKDIMSCLYLSSGCFQTGDLKKIVQLCIENDFNLELSSGLSYSPATLDIANNAIRNLRFLVHNYFPCPSKPFVLNLASSDPDIHQRSVNLCREAIDFCDKMGVPFYSVHAGFALNLYPEDLGKPEIQARRAAENPILRETSYEVFVATVKNLALYATTRHVGLLVENNVVARENIADDSTYPLLLADVAEIQRFFSDITDPAVGLLLDTGHTKVSAATLGIPPERYLEELAPFIRCLHLSDNNGKRDTNSPLTGDSWFVPFLKGMASLPKVIEVYNISLDEMFQQSDLVEKSTITPPSQ